MASKNDKYSMFRNFMINELEITKEDIREWIKESIKEEVKLVVSNTFEKVNPEQMIRNVVYENDWYRSNNQSEFNRKVIAEAAKIIVSDLEISLKKKES